MTAALAGLMLAGCKEDIDMSERYVFTTRTVASYLEAHEQFSEYVRLLKEQPISSLSQSTVYQLMTAYGSYTVFAPSNEAIALYMDSLVIKGIIPEASWDAFPTDRCRDSIREVIIFNSILDGTVQDFLEKQLFVDYLEFCPKEVYDNPDTPGDIW